MKRILLALLILLPVVAYGASYSKTYTFSAETVAESAKVNANFDEIETAVNENDGRIDDNITAIGLNTDDQHTEAHTAASHSDQSATGAQLNELVDTTNADALHVHDHTPKLGSILESMLVGSNAPTDEYLLSFNEGSGGFTWVVSSEGGITDVESDPSPTLGANFDVATYSIVSPTNGDITLAPAGTGDVVVSGSTWSVDASGNAVLNTFDTVAPASTTGGAVTIKEGLTATGSAETQKLSVPTSAAGMTEDVNWVFPDSLPADATKILGIASVSAPDVVLEWQADVGDGGVAGVNFSECFPLYAPNAEIQDSDDVKSVWRAAEALTITEVWCETDVGTVNMDLQIDDGVTPADVMGTDLVCATTAVSDAVSLAGGMAAGETLDFAITSVATAPKRLSVCIEYDFD